MANFSPSRVGGFIAKGAAAASNTARGRSCEDLGQYIFERFTGVELVSRNELDAFGAAETDLAFRNEVHRSGLHFLEPVLIVECKNYSIANVSSHEVAYFATRLRQKGARSGVILTTTAISGHQGYAGVHQLEASLIEGITILVIDADILGRLTSTQDLTATLFAQLVGFRTSGTFQP